MNQLLSLLLFLATTSWRLCAAIDLKIVNAQIAPDGLKRSTRRRYLPGPLLTGSKNSKFSINVIDSLTDTSMNVATSIHWHGLFQQHTNYVDGPAFVTQCPIIPGNSFLYEFEAVNQAGTYWYHSHFQNQYCDGLRGALVVYDPEDPHLELYDIDDENTVITLADWYMPSQMEVSSTLINGKGRYVGGPDVDLAVVNVVKGKRYRFRLVSISCDPNFTFSIDEHEMTVIEVDGTNVQPLQVDSIQIFAGQRYSFVLKANQPRANYWIRSLPPDGSFAGFVNLAVLHYDGARNAHPKVGPSAKIPVSVSPLVETNLHPGLPGPNGADININLAIGFNAGAFMVNGVSFQSPTVPVLLQILSGKQKASDLLPPAVSMASRPTRASSLRFLPLLLVGRFRQNTYTSDNVQHPIHLHGHSFHVVRSAGSDSYNFVNPVVRDVVSIGTSKSDLVTIRFFTDNPGPWFLHCHIDWHLNAGLAVVFAEGVPEVPKQDFTTSA
ncbi:laccase 4 [Russula aff. rugulosa BPL654]|nr:laccase 4 [Russula aff. rugulosa BPL654]